MNSALQVGCSGNAALVETGSSRYSRRVESGLGSALAKLRSRRSSRGARKSDLAGIAPHSTMPIFAESSYSSSRSGLSMTTLAERESEPVAYGIRPGMLGPAEHRGRLMTFTWAVASGLRCIDRDL